MSSVRVVAAGSGKSWASSKWWPKMAQDFETIRFVTRDQWAGIMRVVDANKHRFEPWFPLALRAYAATGCRPAELVGKNGRERHEAEEGYSSPQSGIQEHHGLRARDLLGDDMLYVEGKNTNGGRARADGLKPGTVICADEGVYRELMARAAGAKDPDANLFGLGPSRRPYLDGYWRLTKQVRRLRKLLPPNLRGFEVRWLRHSWAIWALRAGIDLVTIQRQLRHEKLEITVIYLRFAPTDKAKVKSAFAGAPPKAVQHDCPSCGFGWESDSQTGRMQLDGQMGLALTRWPMPQRGRF